MAMHLNAPYCVAGNRFQIVPGNRSRERFLRERLIPGTIKPAPILALNRSRPLIVPGSLETI